MTLSQLRAIEAVAQCGGFSAASKQLAMSQPSVSNHVQSVERYFNIRLFDRSSSNIEPTKQLLDMLPQIRMLLGLADDLEDQMAQYKELQQGALRICYSTYQLAIHHITAFMHHYPDIQLEARAMASHDILALLNDGLIDIGFITARECPAHLIGHELIETEIVLAVPKNHDLLERSPITWAEVSTLRLIQREMTSGSRRHFDHTAKLAQTPLNTRIALGSWGSIVEMVLAGSGIGVAMAAEVESCPDLDIVRIQDHRLKIKHFLAYQPQMQHVAAIKHFANLISHC